MYLDPMSGANAGYLGSQAPEALDTRVNQFLKMTVCVPCHMDRPRVKGLGGSGAGMPFDGGAGE